LCRRSPYQSGSKGGKHNAPAHIDVRLAFRARRFARLRSLDRLLERGRNPGLDLDHIGRTDRFTTKALNTFGDVVLRRGRRLLVEVLIAAHAALDLALFAMDTAVHLNVVSEEGDA